MATIVDVTRIYDAYFHTAVIMVETSDGELHDVWSYYTDYPNLPQYAWQHWANRAVGMTVEALRDGLDMDARPN